MKKINSVNFYPFRNDEHTQFHTTIRNEIEAANPMLLGVTKFLPSYVDAIMAELAANEVEEGSQHTKAIETADLYRDQLYHSLVLHMKSAEVDAEKPMREAAARIIRVLNQVGDMRKQPYNQESGTLTNLGNQLMNNYLNDLNTCMAQDKLRKLIEANNSFIQNFGTRTTELSNRISGDVRAARAVTNEIYNNMMLVINAQVLINDEAPYSSFIDKVNYQIDYYKNTISIRQSLGQSEKSKKNDTPATPAV
jgi:hypothetical protein